MTNSPLDKFEQETLPSGLRLLSLPDANTPSVTLLVLVAAGSKYETKETNGLSHFLEHLVFKGTKKRPRAIDVSQAFDSLGASHNAFTSQEYTGYYGTVWSGKAEALAEILADMYLHPLLPEEEIAKERGVIIEEINLYEDLPQRKVCKMIFELLYGDQPAGWSILGTVDSLKRLQREDFLAYRAKHYLANKTLLVVSGAFDEKRLFPRLEELFASLGSGPIADKPKVIERQSEPQLLLKDKKVDQTHFILGWRTCGLFDARRPALAVLAGLLGRGMSSRLWHIIRNELGAAYYIGADQDSYTDHGFFSVAAGVDNQRRALVVETILKEVARLKSELVPAAELRKVKDYLIGNLYLDLETSASRAFYYGAQEIVGEPIETPAAWRAKLEAVTAADLKNLAEEFFVPAKVNLALIGPAVTRDEFAPLLSL